MHNESPIIHGRADGPSAREVPSADARPEQHGRPGDSLHPGMAQQRQRARRTALWVGGVAVLVYVGFILSGVIGR